MIVYMFVAVVLFIKCTDGSYFRGGTISWLPQTNNPSVINSTRAIFINQRYAWLESTVSSVCSPTTILSYGLIGDNTTNKLNCLSSSTTCTTANFPTNLTTLVPCTDYNSPLNMSTGESSLIFNLTVKTDGLVIGYGSQSTDLSWMPLNMINDSALVNISMYLNLSARSDNGLINSSPTTSNPFVIFVQVNVNTSINIPMADIDGDIIQCRFAESSKNYNGITVDECGEVCYSEALPNATVLFSEDSICTLNVTLPLSGYYAVALQLEDFLENATEPLSSVPLQFVLYAYEESNITTNSSTNCTIAPNITSIDPDNPSPGSTVYAAVNVPYTATINAQSGCGIQPNTSIINFLTISPPGMIKTDVPFLESDGSTYGINLLWVPTSDQLGMNYTFCAIAIDINLYTSEQYCFDFMVGPKTTTSGPYITQPITTITTTSTTTTTTAQPVNYLPLEVGLGIGIGLPLLCLLGFIARRYIQRYLFGFLRSISDSRIGNYTNADDLNLEKMSPPPTRSLDKKDLNKTPDYREQYINEKNSSSSPSNQKQSNLIRRKSASPSTTSAFELGSLSSTTISMFSSATNALPTDRVEHIASSSTNPLLLGGSILVRAYNKQNDSV
ncbi:unnamed protein product [Adineta steineri]|uniref:Uncharacterized protein n=1 Tax=Adineta steineri TaxID=433720 RepID=A0A814W417_9BILA|nr:unnamed protein product [Adineta steineri]